MNEAIADKMCGVVYGQAIGDALGLGTEFMSRREVAETYPGGFYSYDQIVQDEHRSRWRKGAWTDDTDQLLCILDSLVAKGGVHIHDIARRFYHWAMNGGMGIGATVYAVLSAPTFLADPHSVAHQVWQQSGRRAAANGAVMRTAVLGIWQYHDPTAVVANAEQVSQITHADPRCLWSSAAISLVISALLRGSSAAAALQDAVALLPRYNDERIGQYLERVDDLAALDLDEGLNPGEPDRIGYTLKATCAGLWALKHASSFAEGVLAIVQEGGDADTNAAVAGALLGAKFGYAAIPEGWVRELADEPLLRSRVDALLTSLKDR